jgi:hypothetical protein
MTPRTPRVCAAIALVACGCSYDWSIPSASSPSDGGGDVDATVPLDAGAPDAFDASDGALDAPVLDTGADAAANCDSLIATAQSAYALARTCSSTAVAGVTTCVATVKDQCGCDKIVADDSSAATSDYENDVTAIKQADCAGGCGTCPTAPALTCLDMATGDGGVALVCQ